MLALLVLAIIVIVLLWYLLAGRLKEPGPTPPGPPPPTSQSADCPDVMLLSIPGTWESSSADDPYNPQANPISLMLSVSGPLRAQFPDNRLEVYTVPYVAQFSNPIAFPPDGQASYNNSRTEGTARATDVLAQRHKECPLTNFVIAGFSQGAVIAGDVAAQIGAGNGPIPEANVLGVTVIADGRRTATGPGQPTEIGDPPPQGEGAEVALKGVNVPGISMTGPRPGGFGTLASKVNSICAPGDMICDAPRQALNPANALGSLAALIRSAGNPVHALYASNPVDGDGTTATQWTVDWAAGLIENAPHPPHS
ncbi:cutinase family protein [Nocardia salmonicida]|uniref:cutinase family protein n=1 Tax=Nocardia sp. PE-7 TaxID=3058426 RepID=UPI0026595A0E|nr:cutinase family protein [Nocardia sp. PE-7]WKG09749.1 cutinase family protein [Nocardia sp. PE-7]